MLKQLAVHLVDLGSTDQARLANIGSAHLAQTSKSDPPTFGFSFSAMGASLMEAAGSSTISGSTPANLSAKQAAPETPSPQLGSVPSETFQQNRRMPEGALGAFMATTTALLAASFCSGDSTLTMLVDSRATHNFADPFPTPWLQDMMSDNFVLDVPHTIVPAAQHVQDVATGTARGTVIDDGGREKKFFFQAVVLAGMGVNLFCH